MRKTIQALALLSRIHTSLPHLIVVPTSLLFNWKNEIEKFLPGLHPYIHQGAKRAKTIKELSSNSIILTSYTTLRLDLLLFQNIAYHTIILDEAQNIKNAHTQTAQAVCSLTSEFRLSITGTPIENHLNELWSHFHFLIPDLFEDEKKKKLQKTFLRESIKLFGSTCLRNKDVSMTNFYQELKMVY